MSLSRVFVGFALNSVKQVSAKTQNAYKAVSR